jgi:hypothetical protein
MSFFLNAITSFSDFCDRWRPAVALGIQCGKVIFDGYVVREAYREIANQNGPATLRQKVGFVFSLTNLTSSVATLAYQPESVMLQSSQENEKCNRCVNIVSDLIDIHSSAEITEDQVILRESLENCRACVVQSTSRYQSSSSILLTIQMASLLMVFGSRHVENRPTPIDKKFTISRGLEMFVMVDLLSKIYSGSDLKPQKYLYFVLRYMKTPRRIAGIYLQMLQMQQILKLMTQNHV